MEDDNDSKASPQICCNSLKRKQLRPTLLTRLNGSNRREGRGRGGTKKKRERERERVKKKLRKRESERESKSKKKFPCGSFSMRLYTRNCILV